MAKKSQRRPVRHERDQSGCMWGFISMFDFRHGRSTQKLLADKRRGSKHAVAAGSTKNKFELLNNLDENCQSTLDGEENATKVADYGKPSVKKLIEEEMFSEQGVKEEIKKGEVKPKESNSEHGGNKRKNRRHANRSRSKSCDAQIDVLDVAENLQSEQSHVRHLKKQLTKSLDWDEIMEEFCEQIHQKSVICLKHNQNGELQDHPNQKNPDFEEKLSEAVKLFIHQKLISGKNVKEDVDINSSKELMDALEILSSDKELFLKLLQDPKSAMVKYVENLWNNQDEKHEDFEQLVESNLSEQEFPGIKQPDETIHSKQRKFFRRKVKSVEKDQSKEIKVSQASNRIVILKPGPTGLQNSETEFSHYLSPESQSVVRNKGPNDRVGSYFFLTEIKRRWKHAMGKERQEISNDGSSKRFAGKHLAMGNNDKGFKENVGRCSLSKDHFFIEKVAKPPKGVKKGEKIGMVKECEISTQHESPSYPKQRVSNIYIEARKHLSEMLNNGPEDADFTSRQAPKSLGRILSLSEYNSPIDSPGRDWGQSFVTAQIRFSGNDKFQKQENNVSHLVRTKVNIETQSCISDDSSTNDKAQPAPNNSSAPNENVHNNEMEAAVCSIQEDMLSKDGVSIVSAGEILVQEESNVLNTLSVPSKSSPSRDGQNGDVSEVSDGKEHSECFKDDSSQEIQSLSSPSTSPTTSSCSKKAEYLDTATDIPERPSPVSVLEPLFVEEDVSPASTRSQPVELLMQPLRIQFEEHDPSAADQCIHLKTGIEDNESTYHYVKAVLQASGMNWDEFYIKSHSSNRILDPSISCEVEFFPNQLCCDKNLLFDCIDEVLTELYGSYWGCYPGLSFIKRSIRPLPNMKNAICEVWEAVHWHLLPLPLPSTLDQVVKKDMSKTGAWMDLQFDAATFIVDIGEAIFEDLMEDTILSCTSECSESGNLFIPADLVENKSRVDV